jgi:hypothetical protein
MKANERLADWLEKRHARCLWSMDKGRDFRLQGWLIGTSIIIVQVFLSDGQPRGWEMYCTIAETNEVDATLAIAEKRLGLTERS